MNENGQKKIDFGQFTIDPDQRQLFKNGRPTKLAPKTFEVLIRLAQAPNEVVTKDQLIGSVWPDSFVEDANLTVHISALRKVLNGDVKGGAMIETLPKIGYRFVIPDAIADTAVEDDGSESDRELRSER